LSYEPKKWNVAEEFADLNEFSQHISLEKILEMDYRYLEQVLQPKF